MSTPHARGSTCQVCSGPAPTMVYPACAGIHPEGVGHANTRESLPRMRGDPPRGTRGGNRRGQSTLHARGSTWSLTMRQGQLPVYPACAGIHPYGGPGKSTGGTSTPHARGSTAGALLCERSTRVYPACAGIHREVLHLRMYNDSLPRMRGDPPQVLFKRCHESLSTPHARGST